MATPTWSWRLGWNYICWKVKPSGVLGTSIMEKLWPSFKEGFCLINRTNSSALGRLWLLEHWEGALLEGSLMFSYRHPQQCLSRPSEGNWSIRIGAGKDKPSQLHHRAFGSAALWILWKTSSSSCGNKSTNVQNRRSFLNRRRTVLTWLLFTSSWGWLLYHNFCPYLQFHSINRMLKTGRDEQAKRIISS